MSRIRRALISVSDKTGVVELAKRLTQLEVEILSTGGTYRLLEEEGVPVTPVSEVTEFPEMLDGRVKTLHPKIHGGLLGDRDLEHHRQQMEEQQIAPIDLLVVNLYPFQATISKPGVTEAEAIENIDIGGPAMVRSAAKNHHHVTVVVDPTDYPRVIKAVEEEGSTSIEQRKQLAANAFRHTASYDAMIAEYFNQQLDERFPEQLTVSYQRVDTLRYGENPHQQAAYYRRPLAGNGLLASAKQLHGKELSYNNLNDAHAAIELVAEFDQPAVVAIKHTNPCGVGIGENLAQAYQKAYEADPVSIFGGIIATNQPIDAETAEAMKKIFLEIIIAPSFSDEALYTLKEKKNLRLLEMGTQLKQSTDYQLQSVGGGVLIQEPDLHTIEQKNGQVVTDRIPTEEEWQQLLFAWNVVKHVKSNAIVLAQDFRTVGVGAGQMNRVGSAEIAIQQAGELAKNAVMASDAFFPMKDTVERAAAAGVRAIIQPGGSVRDEESIVEANRHGIAMVFTGVRHFKH